LLTYRTYDRFGPLARPAGRGPLARPAGPRPITQVILAFSSDARARRRAGGGEGVVLLVGAGSGGKGVSWPCYGSVRCGMTTTPGRDRPAVVRGRPVGVWGKSGLMARGARLLAGGGSGVLCLGPGDQVSDKVAKTRSCSLLRLVEGAAKPSQHSGAAFVGGLLRGGQEAKLGRLPRSDRRRPAGSRERQQSETPARRRTASTSRSPDRRLGSEAS
jgi:hypothetical protein